MHACMLDENQSESWQSSFRYLLFAHCGRRDRRSRAMGLMYIGEKRSKLQTLPLLISSQKHPFKNIYI